MDGERLDVEPSRSGPGPWIAAWALFVPLAAMRAGTLAESDTFWQVRTGLLTLDTGSLPAVDTFTWTVAGESWTLNSWGFNVVLALGHVIGGLVGVAVLAAMAALVVVALMLAVARRLGASPAVAGALTFAAWLVLVPWLSARPQLVDYVGLLVLILLLDSLARSPEPWWFSLAIGLLSMLWTNLHAGALLAVAVTGMCAVLLLLRAGTRRSGVWALAAAAAAAAGTLVSPYGVRAYSHALVVQAESRGSITEWQSPSMSSVAELAMLVAGIVAVIVAIRRREVVFVAALGVLLAASLTAVRFAPMVLLASVPLLASAVSTQTVQAYLRSRRTVLAAGVAAIMMAVLALSVPALSHLGRPEPSLYPQRVNSLIPPGCRVFTTYLLGGFLTLARPDVTVNIDSRNDLFGNDRVLAAEETLQGRGDVRAALAPAGCVVVPPSAPLSNWLEEQADWSLVEEEATAALHVRTGNPPPF